MVCYAYYGTWISKKTVPLSYLLYIIALLRAW